LENREVETRAAKKAQATTVNQELTILKHMLKMAVKWETRFDESGGGRCTVPSSRRLYDSNLSGNERR
jgi:hypothetical protein